MSEYITEYDHQDVHVQTYNDRRDSIVLTGTKRYLRIICTKHDNMHVSVDPMDDGGEVDAPIQFYPSEYGYELVETGMECFVGGLSCKTDWRFELG